VIVHAGAHGTAQAVRLARAAREAGAAAASLISPPFYPLDEDSLFAHFTAVARAVPGFPLFLYNIPEYAGNDITPGLLLRVARMAENVIGLKHSGDSLERLADYRRVMGRDFNLFCGNDSLALAALEQGADGLVSGNASARPELLVSLYARFREGRREDAAAKQAELDRFIAGRQGASELSFFKALLERRGVPVGEVRPPLARLGAEGRAELRRWLE
jgi:dihydrodipicolinate synthase/N-acetylneuraminate lyase